MASLIQTQEFQGADQNESVLTEQQKKLYKKYLATGDFDKIRNEFSPLYLKRAFSYVGKKCEEWSSSLHQQDDVIEEPHKRKAMCSVRTHRKRIHCQVDSESEEIEIQDLMVPQTKPPLPATDIPKPTFQNPFPTFAKETKSLTFRYGHVELEKSMVCIVSGYQDFLSKHRSCLKETLYNYALNQVQDLLRQQCYVLEGVITRMEIEEQLSPGLLCLTLHCQHKDIHLYTFQPQHPTMKTFPYLIETNTYHQAMKKAEEIYNKFNGLYDPRDLTMDDDVLVACDFVDPSNPSRELVYEGYLYHIKENYLLNPYQCCSVLWYGCSCTTHKWIIEFYQTDNDLSPWELYPQKKRTKLTKQSLYIRNPLSMRRDEICRIPESQERDQQLSVYYTSLVDFLVDEETGIDGIELFISVEDLANNENYTKLISTPMSLNMIRDSIQQKKYHDHDELFWRDLELICQNCKKFNQPERYEWRCADLLECVIHRLHRDLQHDFCVENPSFKEILESSIQKVRSYPLKKKNMNEIQPSQVSDSESDYED